VSSEGRINTGCEGAKGGQEERDGEGRTASACVADKGREAAVIADT
jgi:hypothetical protein